MRGTVAKRLRAIARKDTRAPGEAFARRPFWMHAEGTYRRIYQDLKTMWKEGIR